jgi:hypothetical protein
MAKYLEAINDYKQLKLENNPVLFLAGGISGCTNWQSQVSKSLMEKDADSDYWIVNPRRDNFPMDKPNESEKQIVWEHHGLDIADCVSFWFAEETLCPITLFELGIQLGQHKNVVVGIHPNYKRRQDLEIQIPLYNRFIPIVYSLADLVDTVSRRMNSLFLYKQD